MAYGKLPDLCSQNFQQNSGLSGFMKADTSLFVFQTSNYVIYILIYVDDILITGSSASAITNIINSL
jgi:hypothetical protein